MSVAVVLASYKLMFEARRVRALPRTVAGAPFTGPGVDLLGADAEAVFAAARPLLAWLAAREPGVSVRSISVDLTRPRVIVTLGAAPKPRVLRVDGGAAVELLDEAAAVEAAIGPRVADAIEARVNRSP